MPNYQQVNTEYEIEDGETELVLQELSLERPAYLAGALKTDVAVTLRVSSGKVGDVWLDVDDYDYEAGEGDQFEFRLTSRQCKLEVVNASGSAATVQIDCNFRTEG